MQEMKIAPACQPQARNIGGNNRSGKMHFSPFKSTHAGGWITNTSLVPLLASSFRLFGRQRCQLEINRHRGAESKNFKATPISLVTRNHTGHTYAALENLQG